MSDFPGGTVDRTPPANAAEEPRLTKDLMAVVYLWWRQVTYFPPTLVKKYPLSEISIFAPTKLLISKPFPSRFLTGTDMCWLGNT